MVVKLGTELFWYEGKVGRGEKELDLHNKCEGSMRIELKRHRDDGGRDRREGRVVTELCCALLCFAVRCCGAL